MWFPSGKGAGVGGAGVRGWQTQTIVHGTDGKGLLCSTGNFIQYPVTNYKEKNIKINKTVVFNCPLPQKNLCGIPICREVRLRISIVDQ